MNKPFSKQELISLYLNHVETVNARSKSELAEAYGWYKKDPLTGDSIWVDPRQQELFPLSPTDSPKKSLDSSQKDC